MANFVNYNFYFFTDKDYALLLKEYNEIIQKVLNQRQVIKILVLHNSFYMKQNQ